VTVPPRTPSWGEIEEFCRIDGWQRARETDHRHYEKLLSGDHPDNPLQTHVSHDSDGTMSQDRFSLILRTQLKISRREFWEALQTGEPVDRPVPEEEPTPPVHEAWVVMVLRRELRLSDEEIAALSPAEAAQRVHELWSRPRAE
jgi:hypothetical protein